MRKLAKALCGGLVLLAFILSAACALATDFDTPAYYNVTWASCVISEDTERFATYYPGEWAEPQSMVTYYQKKYADDPEQMEAGKNVLTEFRYDGFNEHCLVWYGWVGKDGYWRGHIYGLPTVTNLITGETVTVTKWSAHILQTGLDEGREHFLGEWDVSGTGSLIDKDTIAPNLPQTKGCREMPTETDWYNRGLTVRLYLSDGNSIQLHYHSETSGMQQPDAVTAYGGRVCHAYKARIIDDNGERYYCGSIDCAIITLGEPTPTTDYHFYLEKTVTGVADNAKYTFPINISVNGGESFVVEISTTGSGTFTKEFTFTGYPTEYQLTATEDKAQMPQGISIVTGSAAAAASKSTVAKNSANTLKLTNTYVPATGDSTPLALLIALSVLSGTALVLRKKF